MKYANIKDTLGRVQGMGWWFADATFTTSGTITLQAGFTIEPYVGDYVVDTTNGNVYAIATISGSNPFSFTTNGTVIYKISAGESGQGNYRYVKHVSYNKVIAKVNPVPQDLVAILDDIRTNNYYIVGTYGAGNTQNNTAFMSHPYVFRGGSDSGGYGFMISGLLIVTDPIGSTYTPTLDCCGGFAWRSDIGWVYWGFYNNDRLTFDLDLYEKVNTMSYNQYTAESLGLIRLENSNDEYQIPQEKWDDFINNIINDKENTNIILENVSFAYFETENNLIYNSVSERPNEDNSITTYTCSIDTTNHLIKITSEVKTIEDKEEEK